MGACSSTTESCLAQQVGTPSAAPRVESDVKYEIHPEDCFDVSRYGDKRGLLMDLFTLIDIDGDGFLIYMRESDRSLYVQRMSELGSSTLSELRKEEARLASARDYAGAERVRKQIEAESEGLDGGLGDTKLSMDNWLCLHEEQSFEDLLQLCVLKLCCSAAGEYAACRYAPVLRGFAQDVLNGIWEHMDQNGDGHAQCHEVEEFVLQNFPEESEDDPAISQSGQRLLFMGMMIPGPGDEPVLDRSQLAKYLAGCSPVALRVMYGSLLEQKGIMELGHDFTDEELASALHWKFPTSKDVWSEMPEGISDAECLQLVRDWRRASKQ